ncbi:hypothetical protein ARMSODRAFT_1009872 [Armillaria solidipes]|uniref:Uncharacterized protein n=1 Tax=Armillaria solidipes TaxID=1076256 RepID=A0A2H3AN22_9AGAR|nr:hypothetical protein ARMSODRAFT_1009872 [Armillaria solidipes]
MIFKTIKRALGDGGYDTLTQASYSILSMWNHYTLSFIRDKCCCRTLILAGGVPCLDPYVHCPATRRHHMGWRSHDVRRRPLISPLHPSATASRR